MANGGEYRVTAPPVSLYGKPFATPGMRRCVRSCVRSCEFPEELLDLPGNLWSQ